MRDAVNDARTHPTPLSVVMPAYNEEEVIARAVQEVQRHVLDQVPGSELMVVNDGSSDATGAILDKLATDPRVRVLHRRNGGHGPALRSGMDEARGAWLFLLDSDRQIPLEGFAALWGSAADVDGIFGVRRERDDPWVRLWLTQAIRVALRVLFGVAVRDANVPFKLLRASLWADARPFIPADTLAPSLFLAVFAAVRGYRIRSVQVPHRRRSTGVPSIRAGKLLRLSLRGFGQLLRFRKSLRRG